jgi:hypothetical protein
MKSNRAILSETRSRCEALAVKVAAGKFPVRLSELLTERGVSEVWFQPMLADGVLAKDEDRFLIGLHAFSGEVAECERRLRDRESAKLLPNRQRFALAHELAHTFFYDFGRDEITETIKLAGGGGKTSDELLEETCDRLAGSLLLPEAILRESISDRFLAEPDEVRQIAVKAGVSLVTLLIRCEQLELFSKRYRWRHGQWRFVHSLFGMGFAVPLVQNLAAGDSLRLWLNAPTSCLFGGAVRTVEVALETRTGGGVKDMKHCRVTSESRVSADENAWTIVSITDLMRE